jgi:hypothetical protein
MLDNWSLDYKDKTIFNSKRNEEKVIDGWDVKIEKKLKKKIWEDPFSHTHIITTNRTSKKL